MWTIFKTYRSHRISFHESSSCAKAASSDPAQRSAVRKAVRKAVRTSAREVVRKVSREGVRKVVQKFVRKAARTSAEGCCQLIYYSLFVLLFHGILYIYIYIYIRRPFAGRRVRVYALPISYKFTQSRTPARFYLDPATPTLPSSATLRLQDAQVLWILGFSDSQTLC